MRRLLAAAGRDRAPRWPEIVQVESTNICNARCVFCPRDQMTRRQGVMDQALYEKVVGECVELGIRHLRLHNYGEPFVDRQPGREDPLRQVTRHRRGRPHQQRLAHHRGQVARGIVEAGLDAINISVDASGREVFESTRVGLKFDQVIANIERIVRVRGELRTRAAAG